MPTLVVDSQGRPLPQILDKSTGDMAPWQGKNGGGDVNLREYTPQSNNSVIVPTAAIPTVLLIPDGTGGYLLPASKVYGVSVDVTRVQGVIKIDNTTPIVCDVHQKDYDGTTWSDHKNKVVATLLTSAARTATTITNAIVNTSVKHASVILDITAGTGIISKFELLATINGTDYVIGSVTLPTLAVPGTYVINIGHNVQKQEAAHPFGINVALPSAYKYRVTQDANSVTYSLHEIATD
jgi:hypothetical protein